jgi:mRNA interferase HigB
MPCVCYGAVLRCNLPSAEPIIDWYKHVISRKALQSFWQRQPDSERPLRGRYKLMATTVFGSFAELHETFPSAHMVDDLTVFNIGGNKYRLIASIHYDRHKVYVRHIMTHAEYDQGKWK